MLLFLKLFGSERGNVSLTLLKLAEKYYYPNLLSVWVNFRQKKSFLIRSEILGVLLNTVPTDYEYSRSNTDKLQLPIQMQLTAKL